MRRGRLRSPQLPPQGWLLLLLLWLLPALLLLLLPSSLTAKSGSVKQQRAAQYRSTGFMGCGCGKREPEVVLLEFDGASTLSMRQTWVTCSVHH